MPVMAVGYLNPIGRGGKTEGISPVEFACLAVVLIERADRHSVTVLTPDCGVWKVVRSKIRKESSAAPVNEERRKVGRE